MMQIYIRPYRPADLSAMAENLERSRAPGRGFPHSLKRWKPQTQHPFSQNNLTAPWHRRPKTARSWGLYILHPNNIGRCSHIANASFAVSSTHQGQPHR